MDSLLQLAERCEAAEGREQRELLKAAYATVFGGPECKAINKWPGYSSPRWDKFHAMLGAEAYESAAMMLVQEEYRFNLNKRPFAKGRQDGYHAQVWFSRYYETASDIPHAWAATPALALCAAALRARHSQGVSDNG